MAQEQNAAEVARLRVLANKLRLMGNLTGAMDVAGRANAMERMLETGEVQTHE